MPIVIGLFIIFVIVTQTLMGIEWILRKFGFFKNSLQKALKCSGYTQDQYYAQTDLHCIKAVRKELLKLQSELYYKKDTNSSRKKRSELDSELVSNAQMEKWYWQIATISNVSIDQIS